MRCVGWRRLSGNSPTRSARAPLARRSCGLMNSREKNFPLEFEENQLLLKINPKKSQRNKTPRRSETHPICTQARLLLFTLMHIYTHYFFFRAHSLSPAL